MAVKTAAELKAYFETGDVPTQQQFVDLIDTIFTGVPNYKVYIATLNQSGTGAPVASNVLANTLTDAPTFYYDAVGRFRVGSDDFGTLTGSKVFVICGGANQNNSAKTLDYYLTTAPIERETYLDKAEIALETVNGTVPTNGLLYETQIEIRVYN